ncbi:pentapeptide repeat-containing protein [Leptolyngbya cf. ectocarpi LEGE 11479]|uniref:Pentapeptide repeat-containing protein n=1 Tax=Leptolyngbya cf. ectocarpi LEGE 11479 TaxID=1828722 RepID=A0A928ZXI1_LEPEC|nr:pentapeptide repeat-containing protein [Leptolyngbya ectocarpi]MBE9069253.1 pentapeptide repeat-containing protein [Leptolyngbya cf. ectocarpi LEGE 11479]
MKHYGMPVMGKNSTEDIAAALHDIKKAIENIKPPQKPEKNFISKSLKAVLKIGTYLTGLTIFVSLATYFFEADDRHQSQINEAWKTILASTGQSGDAGRRDAISFLTSSPRRLPFFWWRWEPQSLDGIQVPNAILVCIDMSEASLYRANFSGADLSGADLTGANLSSANLSNAKFSYSDTKVCDRDIDDESTSPSLATLHKANLTSANLRFAELSEVDLSESVLRNADLSGADLRGAKFGAAELLEADLSNANLWGTDLSKVSFSVASDRDAESDTSAILCGAVLLEVDLRNQNLDHPGTVYRLFEDSESEKCQDPEFETTQRTSPYICKVRFPEGFTRIDPNRDCDEMQGVLLNRYNISARDAVK